MTEAQHRFSELVNQIPSAPALDELARRGQRRRRRRRGILGGTVALVVAVAIGVPIALHNTSRHATNVVVPSAPTSVSPTSSAPPTTVFAPVVIPQLGGTTSAQAREALLKLGLKPQIISGSSAVVPAGTVVSSTPPAGSVTVAGSVVTLSVSSGPAGVVIPDVIGATATQAGNELVSRGVAVNVTQAPSSVVPAGTVVSSTPPPGTRVAPGSVVVIVVSSGRTRG